MAEERVIEPNEFDRVFENDPEIGKGFEEESKAISKGEEQAAKELAGQKIKIQKKVAEAVLLGFDFGVEPSEATKFFNEFEKVFDSLPEKPTLEDYKRASDLLENRYGDVKKATDRLIKSTSYDLTRSFKKLAPNYEWKRAAEMRDVAERIKSYNEGSGEPLKPGELEKLKDNLKEASEDIDKNNPDLKEKMEGKVGEKGWKILKMLIMLGGLIGSVLLISHFLKEMYDGCYSQITEGDATKLNCGITEENCRCGDIRGRKIMSDSDCSKSYDGKSYAEFPFCKGSCRGTNPTCDEVAAQVQKGGINYVWQSYSPFDALLKGVDVVGNKLLESTGLTDLAKYFKYIVIGIIAFMGLVFLIWIGMEVKNFLGKRSSSTGSSSSSEPSGIELANLRPGGSSGNSSSDS